MKIALVSYLNTTPFLEGLKREFQKDEVELLQLPPAMCAEYLKEGKADLALVPVGALFELPDADILHGWCIAGKGKVDSVFLFSEVPISEVTEVIMDPHSRTSNMLVKVLFRHWWRKKVRFIEGISDQLAAVTGTVAAVGIGDKALLSRGNFLYATDLAQAWMDCTGLPMVFAVWAFRRGKVMPATLQRVNAALSWGASNLQFAADQHGPTYGYSAESALSYLRDSLDFIQDQPKENSMALFRSWAKDEMEREMKAEKEKNQKALPNPESDP